MRVRGLDLLHSDSYEDVLKAPLEELLEEARTSGDWWGHVLEARFWDEEAGDGTLRRDDLRAWLSRRG